jgi:hypothetical protein
MPNQSLIDLARLLRSMRQPADRPPRLAKDTNMTRSHDLSTRFAAFAASLLFASISLIATVGPAVPSFPLA